MPPLAGPPPIFCTPEAQRHPEAYRNLVVKVAGYSALFAMLDKELQDQLIARTTHDLG